MAKVSSKINKIKTTSVVKNPVAKEAKELKKSAEVVLTYANEAKTKITRITKEINLNNKQIEDIQAGKYSKTNQIKDIDARIEVAKKSKITKGIKKLTRKEEQAYKGYLNTLNSPMEVTNFKAKLGYNDETKNPIYADYKKSFESLKNLRNQLKKEGYGSGSNNKLKYYPNKITQVKEEIGKYKEYVNKHLTSELKKYLNNDISIYEKQMTDIASNSENLKNEQNTIENDIQKIDTQINKIANNTIDIQIKLNELNEKKANAWDKKIPLAEERSRFLNRDDSEEFTDDNIYDNTRTAKQRMLVFKTHGKGGFVRELNHLIYQDIINFLSKTFGGDIPNLFVAYARSHKLYYDHKTKRLEYYDKEGNGWGLFENETFYMDYEVAHPNGPILGKPLTSHQIIQMAEDGRNGYTILAGQHTTHDKIAIPASRLITTGGGTFGGHKFEGAMFKDEMYVKPVRNKGYFGIGLRTFVSNTVKKYQDSANRELSKIRKEIKKQDDIIKKCNAEIKELNAVEKIRENNTKIKHLQLNKKKLENKLEIVIKNIENNDTKLNNTRMAYRIDKKLRKIQEKLRAKHKYETFLKNYDKKREELDKLEKHTEELKRKAINDYIESNRKSILEKKQKEKEEILKSKTYQRFKKFYADNDKKNKEIMNRNQELKNKKISELENLKTLIEQSYDKDSRVKILMNRNDKLLHEKETIRKEFKLKKDDYFKKMEKLKNKLILLQETKKTAKKQTVNKGIKKIKEEAKKVVDKEVEQIIEKKLNITIIRKWIDDIFKSRKISYKKQKYEVEMRLNKYLELGKINKKQYNLAMKYLNNIMER